MQHQCVASDFPTTSEGSTSALRKLASAAATTLYDQITHAQSEDQLHYLGRLVWRGYGEGVISDQDASFLQEYVDRRRPRSRATAPGFGEPIGRAAGRIGSRFTPRSCRKRLSDAERRERHYRKRTLGGSSAMPPNMRFCYTEGERAVLCVVAGEVKYHGVCDLSVKEIADRAGVGWTTTQNALHEARRLGHVEIIERPQRGRKNLTNLIEVTRAEWRAWIKRGPSAARAIGSNSFKNVSPTKSTDSYKEELITDETQQAAFRGVPTAGPKPLNLTFERRKAAGE